MVKTLIQVPATKEHGALLITAEVKNKVAYLTIDGYIGRWGDASTNNLKREIKLTGKDATEAELYINSEGGDCFQANEMVNILEDTFGKENIKIRVGAMAASAASYIVACFRENATAKKNSRGMIHKPSMHLSGNEDKVESNLKLLKDLTEDYKQVYAEAFGITPDEVETLWKQDYWMNAKEMKKKGMVASIENEVITLDANAKMRLVAAGAPGITMETPTPPNTNNQNTNTDMNKEVTAMSLGLPKDATEAQIEAKIADLKTKAATADALQKKLDDQQAATATAQVTALLDQAETDKKLTGDMRATYQTLAEANFDAAKKAIEALPATEKIDVQASAQNPAGTLVAEFKTYQEILDAGEKGAEAFAKLQETNPTEAEALLNAHYAE